MRTDENGKFQVDGLPVGLLRIRARDVHSDVAELEVFIPAGGVAQAELVLGAPARVVGRVSHTDGSPVAGATVRLASDGDPLAESETVSDATGSFELEGVPVGTIALVAELDTERLAVRTEIETRAGQEFRWDAVFPSTLSLRGTLTDEQGQTLAGWQVQRETMGLESTDGNMAQASSVTDSAGQFNFPNCPDQAQKLVIRAPGQWFGEAAHFEGALPGTDTLIIRVEDNAVPKGLFLGGHPKAASDGHLKSGQL